MRYVRWISSCKVVLDDRQQSALSSRRLIGFRQSKMSPLTPLDVRRLSISSVAIRITLEISSDKLPDSYSSIFRQLRHSCHDFSSFQEWANAMARRPSSVRLSVCKLSNRFFSQANGWIATKLAHDGHQVSMHPGCAQGQGQRQRSRDMRTF